MAGVAGMTGEPLRTAPATDDRPPARGAGLVVVAVYVVFALSATARAGVQLIRDASEAPLAYGLSAFAALVYVVAAVGLAHNGRRMRRIATTAVVVELVGVVVVRSEEHTSELQSRGHLVCRLLLEKKNL